MLRIWGRANAFNVQKAMWAIGEVGVPYECIDAGGSFGGLDAPVFLAMNPYGRIPVIDDGGVIAWESNAIIRCLAAKYAAGNLWPEDPGARVGADKWMDWNQNHLYHDFIDLFWGYVRTPERERDWPRLNLLIDRCAKGFSFLDRHLSANDYLAGSMFTMADIPAGTSLYRYFELDIEHPEIPHVRRWYARLCERPAYQKHVMLPFSDLVGRKTF